MNNLKQLGLAAHHYHDTRDTFPPGFTSDASGHPYPSLSWLARLLPYIEQGQLWSQVESAFAQERRPFIVPPHTPRGVVVKSFICPSDDRIQVPGKNRTADVAFTSYLGVQGRSYPSTNGILYPDSRVQLVQVTDGTSHTLFAGERPPSTDLVFGWWYTGIGQDEAGSGAVILGVRERRIAGNYRTERCPPGPYQFRDGSLNEQCDLFHLWSTHPGGANFLLTDGSVRFLGYSADQLLPTLATRAGGETVVLN
jgi:prepilin-type processing-associated H-X9-DG protein